MDKSPVLEPRCCLGYWFWREETYPWIIMDNSLENSLVTDATSWENKP